MTTLLVIPPVVYRRQPPIGPAYLAAYLRDKGEKVAVMDLNPDIEGINDGDDGFWAIEDNARKFIDENSANFKKWAEEILAKNADIIGFNIWSTNRLQTLELVRLIREKDPNKLIVFGGPEAVLGLNLFRDLDEPDVIVKGEGERAFLEIIRQYRKTGSVKDIAGTLIRENGKLKESAPRVEIEDLDSLPFPDFSDYELDKYLFQGHIPISFGRGCVWKCGFCTVENSWDKFRTRSASSVFEEIKLRMKELDVKKFVNADPSLNQDLDMLAELARLMIAEGIQVEWEGMAQIKPAMDAEYLKNLNRSGCVLMNYGVESGSAKVLRLMRKPYTPEEAFQVIKDTCEAGIKVVMNFVVGYPGETEKEFQETLDFIYSVKDYVFNIAHGHPCLIVPESPLYRYPEKYNLEFSVEDSYNWTTKDGTNTAAIREERAERFDKFLDDLEIEARCGQDDRAALDKETETDE